MGHSAIYILIHFYDSALKWIWSIGNKMNDGHKALAVLTLSNLSFNSSLLLLHDVLSVFTTFKWWKQMSYPRFSVKFTLINNNKNNETKEKVIITSICLGHGAATVTNISLKKDGPRFKFHTEPCSRVYMSVPFMLCTNLLKQSSQSPKIINF